MGTPTSALKMSELLKGWRTLKGDHYCPDCWKEYCKKFNWQKALEQNSASVATSSIVDSDEVAQGSGCILCITCDTMVLIR